MNAADRTFCALVAQCPCQKKTIFSTSWWSAVAIRRTHAEASSSTCLRASCRARWRSSRLVCPVMERRGSSPYVGSASAPASAPVGLTSPDTTSAIVSTRRAVDLGRRRAERRPPQHMRDHHPVGHALTLPEPCSRQVKAAQGCRRMRVTGGRRRRRPGSAPRAAGRSGASLRGTRDRPAQPAVGAVGLGLRASRARRSVASISSSVTGLLSNVTPAGRLLREASSGSAYPET